VTTDAAPAEVRLSSSEALLWTIERDPLLRSTIVVVGLLDRPPDDVRLRARLAAAAETFPRLRQRVEPDRRGLRWVDAGTAFDLDHHLRRYRLAGSGSLRQVLDDAGVLAGETFDQARPLWQVVVAEGLEGGGAALIVKLHHAVTDGVGGVELLPMLTDPADGDRPARLRKSARTTRREPQVQRVLRTAETTVEGIASHPAASLAAVPRVARSVGRLLRPAGPPLSPVAAGRGLGRHLDTLEYPLDALSDAAHAVGGTLNDAFVSAVIGGLHRYHEKHGCAPDKLRVTMPISTRRPGDAPGGNRFTPARFVLPLAIADPAERMRAVGEITRAWRKEPALALTDVLAAALAHLPSDVTASVFGSMLKGVDFVATNVPGVTERTWIAGAELLRLYAFAPPSGAALNVALLSHGATCCIGINSDTDAIADPEVLSDCLADGFAEVVEVGACHDGTETPPTFVAPPAVDRAARLTALDTAFLQMESTNTPMHVGALLELDGELLLDEHGELRITEIRTELASRLDRCPRMRQKLQEVPLGAARPLWVDEPDFDIARHVHSLALPPPGTHRQLSELCATLQMRLLDRSRPLWEMWFVSGLADGSVGLIYKVHHALVDGVSAAETFELLLGDGPLGDGPVPAVRRTVSTSPVSGTRLLWDAAVDSFRATVDAGRTAAQALARPERAVQTAAQVAAVLSRARFARGPWPNRPVGSGRTLAAATFDLRDVKAIGRKHGATVNDVVLAVVTGALRSALVAGGSPPTRPLQALVPVSLHAPDARGEVGNLVTGLVVPLPVDADDAGARLATIVAHTTRLKSGPEGAGMAALLRAADYWPVPALGATARLVGHQPFVNVVVTNVRGSEDPLRLLGAAVRQITPIVPLGRNLPAGVAVLSYAGALVVSVYVDADSGLDADHIASSFTEAFHELHDLKELR
jgi:WS/DGAT/MGAT family acyltransferase